jgi:PAS domain S-box-containing protein
MAASEDDGPERAAELRRQAERIVDERAKGEPDPIDTRSPEETRSTLHELQVHQVELEMQNDELRRVQAELDASRERYFELYDHAPVGYITLNEWGAITEANLGAEQALGVERGALREQPIERFIFTEDQDSYYFVRKSLADTGCAQACELRMVSRADGPFWVQLRTCAAKKGANESPTSRIVFFDIRERKEAELAREKLQAQLNQARKLESVGRLAGGVAHDFNNILMVIIGHAHVVLDELGAEHSLREDVEQIKKAAQRSAELTRQLLSYARKQVVAPKVLDLNDSVTDMMSMLRRMTSAGIDLRWTPTPGLWPVEIDPSQLDQILVNLCINASAAITGNGAIDIAMTNESLDAEACTGRAQATPGEYVRLVVTDTGHGMDEETLEHIFEPFFTTRAFGSGTGLGLATVYGAIQQNHGFIEVNSAEGSGTKFSVFFPRHGAEVEPAVGPREAKPLAVGHETILVVDDESSVLSITAKLLSQQGYVVLTASSAQRAIELAEQYAGEIELLVTDVVMPEMNGRQLSEKLLSLYPALKCLFVSGYSADVMSRAGILNHDAYFAQKPVEPPELAAKVREALDAAPLARAVAQA